MVCRQSILFGLCCSLLIGGAASANAAAPGVGEKNPSISIELNNAQPVDNACRLSFLIQNSLGSPLDAMSLEIVILDNAGLVQDLMVLSTGALAKDKRRLRQFDLPGGGCEDLGEILINDVADCQGETVTKDVCLKALEPSSKTRIKLGL